jgi:CBS domain containing-hemolysin-like protein
MSILFGTVLLVLLAAAAAGFSALETALSLLRDSPAEEGKPRRAEIARNPVAFLNESLLFGAIANLLLTAAGIWFLTGPMRALGVNPWLGAVLVFGTGMFAVEILPKTFALRAPDLVLRLTLPLLKLAQRLFSRAAGRLMRLSDALVRRLSPRGIQPRLSLALEEIETLIEMSEEQGAITTEDATVMQEIVNLHSQTVRDCMTPRVDLPLMSHDADDQDAAQMLQSARFRHVPVFDERADAIIALVDTDAWRLAGRPAWKIIARHPVFVPETMSALDVLRRHLPDSASAVVIVDEYGGFEGLLTRRNLVERLLGKIAPTRTTEPAVQPIGNNRHLVTGMARVDEVNRELDISLEAGGIDTIGGFIFNRLGYLPKPGEVVELDGLSIKVKRIARNRILQMEVRVPAKEAEDKP